MKELIRYARFRTELTELDRKGWVKTLYLCKVRRDQSIQEKTLTPPATQNE
jgi:hypothetical protein